MSTNFSDSEPLEMEIAVKGEIIDKIAGEVPCGIYQTRVGGIYEIVYANEFYYSMFGYTKEEVRKAGFNLHKFLVYAPDLHRIKTVIEQNIANGKYEFEFEAREMKKSGEHIWTFSRCKYNKSTGLITAVAIDITSRKEMEERLRISEEGYRIAAKHSEKLVLRYDIKTRKLFKPADDTMPFKASHYEENVPYSVVARGYIAPESIDAYLGFYEAMLRGEPRGSVVARMIGGYDKLAWYRGDFTMIFSENGEPLQAIVSFVNITEQREKELAYEKWRQSIMKLPQESIMLFEYNLTRDICGHQEGGLMSVSNSKMPELFNERTRFTADRIVSPEDRHKYLEFVNREYLLSRYYQGENEVNMEFKLVRSDGVQRWINLSIQMVPYPDSSDIKAYLLYQDIDKRKRKEIWLQVRSETDMLTGVYNRDTFIDKVNTLLKESGTTGKHAFIMIDLDHFKHINDMFGHSTGDDVLIETGKNLKLLLRSGDLIGRLGGDEFMICLKNIPYAGVIERRAQLICKILHTQIGADCVVTGSLGISLFPRDGLTFEELYKKADIALYRAKEFGRNRCVFYEHDLTKHDKAAALTPIDALM